jgi:DNA-binding SARP family transcriptional activator/tetratricopeptide (TPR) repeat protein
MRFGLLGTVTVAPHGNDGNDGNGRTVQPVRSAKTRALLAALLAAPGHAVPLELLKSALWGENPPATANASLHNHVARLRRLLAEAGGEDRAGSRLRSAPSGYVLDVTGCELDVVVFNRHHLAARAAHRDEDWPGVLRECAAALTLWRGEPLSDVPLLSDPLRAFAAHLAEAHLLTLEWRFDAELALGRHQGLAAELAGLATAHPLRETFHRQSMLALHRTHRQAEALAAFHKLRRTLVDELGVEPGPAVRATYQEILADPRPPAPPGRPAQTRAGTAAAPQPGAGGAGTQQSGPGGVPSARPAPAQLPADTSDFTGRAASVAVLLAALRDPAASRTSRVAVVSGMGGVGKTALAVRAAHLLQADFPDGQLYADLRGFGAGGARRPGDLVARFLADLGEAGQPLPEDPDDRSVVWRNALHGRRVLLVLDNAAEAAQVVPLLPGDGGSAVVVTSRRTLADLPGALRLPLEPLTADEQRRLLVTVCGEQRVAAEPEAAAGVLAACGGLPLALRIAGSRMTARPNWPLTALAERLDGVGGARLHALAAGGLAVRDTFAMSYVAMRDSPLAPERAAARAFRLLGLWPEHALAPASAAALLGPAPVSGPAPGPRQIPGPGPLPALGTARAGAEAVHAAEDVLEALVDAHLLQTPQPGAYTFHDLLGEYAACCASAEVAPGERREALRRLAVWYAATATATAAVLTPEAHPIPPLEEQPAVPALEFGTDEAAMRWCVRELPAIREAVRLAAAHGWPEVAWRLAAGLFGYAQAYWWTGEWTACLEEAMECVTKHGDVLGQAWMHSRLGVAYGMANRHDACLEQLRLAQGYFEAAGDERGRAAILTNLTALHRGMGEYEQALDYGRQSLELHRALGDFDRVATVLGNLGDSHLFAGDPAAAESCFREALAAWRSRGSTGAIARTLTSLGESLLALDRPAEARDALEENLMLLDRLGDRANAADALEVLGRAHLAGGDRATARKCWEEALDVARAHQLPAREEAALKSLTLLDAPGEPE